MDITFDDKKLREHQDSLQRIACALIGDGHLAEDVVQQTWVTAISRDEPLRSERGWLAGVTRNLARRARRGETRRRRREETAAVPNAVATDDIEERLDAQRAVAEVLKKLREPYRETLFRRYYRDQTPSQIASDLKIPISTVKSRLQRGLALLREALDLRYGGDRARWCTALAVYRTPTLASSVAALLGSKVALLAFAAAALTLIVWIGSEPAPVENLEARASGKAAAPAANDPPIAFDESRIDVTEPAPTAAEPTAAPVVSQPTDRITGRALNVKGQPQVGVPVFATGAKEPVAITRDGGAFELKRPEKWTNYSLDLAGYATLLWGMYHPDHPSAEPIVVAAPTIRVSGHVRTETGEPPPRVALRFDTPESLYSELGISRVGTQLRVFQTASNEAGDFALDLPAVPGAQLSVSTRDDPDPVAKIEAPLVSVAGLEIVLPAPTRPVDGIRGLVVDRQGQPVEGALVSFVQIHTRTGRDGLFEMPRPRAPASRLIAIQEGLQPGIHEGPDDPAEWPEFVHLVLGGESLSVSGQIIEEDGTPIENACVWIEDPTAYVSVKWGTKPVESVVAGDQGDEEATDGDGRFSLEGLADRPYRLGVFDGATFRRRWVESVHPGPSPISVVLPAVDANEVVAGRVVSSAGDPIEGALVRLTATYRPANPWRGASSYLSEASKTDADGRFRFEPELAYFDAVSIGGDGIVETNSGLPERRDLSELELVADRWCDLALIVDGVLADADAFTVLDPEGRTLPLVVMQGRRRRTTGQQAVLNGKTAVYAVPESAATVLLLRGGEEIHRQQIVLEPGSVNRIEMAGTPRTQGPDAVDR